MDTNITTFISLPLFCNFGTKYTPSSIAQMKLIYKMLAISPALCCLEFLNYSLLEQLKMGLN